MWRRETSYHLNSGTKNVEEQTEAQGIISSRFRDFILLFLSHECWRNSFFRISIDN